MPHVSAKSLHARIKSAGVPGDAQLAMIRQFTLADMSADALYVRSFVIAHNAIDRDGECFDEMLLGDFARTLPGKGLFICHPMGWDGGSGPGEGRWFDAHTERVSLDAARTLLREPGLMLPPDRTDVTLLYANGYIAKTADNASLLTKLDAGVAGDVSIGFNYADAVRVMDADGRELNVFRLTAPGEALEASLVWLGAQPGARAMKGATLQSPENGMNPQELKDFDAAKAEAVTHKAAAEANAKAATSLIALKSALGDNGALLDAPSRLAEFVSSGKDYRNSLIDTVVAGERHRGLIGDTDADVQTAKGAYAELPSTKLKVLADTIGKTAPKPGITGADPNARAPGGKGFATDHVFHNPLISGVSFAAAA
jgi:hypothetical protein